MPTLTPATWTIDPEAWTCPRCETTRRVPWFVPVAAREGWVKGIRDKHRCPR